MVFLQMNRFNLIKSPFPLVYAINFYSSKGYNIINKNTFQNGSIKNKF